MSSGRRTNVIYSQVTMPEMRLNTAVEFDLNHWEKQLTSLMDQPTSTFRRVGAVRGDVEVYTNEVRLFVSGPEELTQDFVAATREVERFMSGCTLNIDRSRARNQHKTYVSVPREAQERLDGKSLLVDFVRRNPLELFFAFFFFCLMLFSTWFLYRHLYPYRFV